MKGSLTFDLPEDDTAFKQAVEAPQVLADLGEFSEWMRQREKWGDLPEERAKELAEIRKEFYEMMGRHFEE